MLGLTRFLSGWPPKSLNWLLATELVQTQKMTKVQLNSGSELAAFLPNRNGNRAELGGDREETEPWGKKHISPVVMDSL